MGDNEAVVAFSGVFFLFGLPVIAFMVMRVLGHRERIEMIRHGFDPRLGRDAYTASQSQGQYSAPPYGTPPPPNAPPGYFVSSEAQTQLRKGVVVVAVGLALTIGLSYIGNLTGPPGTWQPGPWLLGGLVPLFVGLAQVLSALLAGATFRPYGPPPQQRFGPPPSPGAMPPPTEPSVAYPGSTYTYRPGQPELRPPPEPPTKRL